MKDGYIIDSSTHTTSRKKPLADANVSGPAYQAYQILHVAGALTAAEYFNRDTEKEGEIRDLAMALYRIPDGPDDGTLAP